MSASELKAGAQWTEEMYERLRHFIWAYSDRNHLPLNIMAEEAGHEAQLLHQWINRTTRPEIPALVDVAEYTDLSLDWLFFGAGRYPDLPPVCRREDWRERIHALLVEDYERSACSLMGYAERFGTTGGSIRNWIKLRKLPPRDALIVLLKRTGVSADWLIYGIGEKYRDGRAST